MRKNIASVIDAFHSHDSYQDKTCRTDGRVIYSYAMPIATHYGSVVYVLDPAESPSRTTTSQIRAVLAALPGARTKTRVQLQFFVDDRDTAPEDDDGPVRSRGDREDFHADG